MKKILYPVIACAAAAALILVAALMLPDMVSEVPDDSGESDGPADGRPPGECLVH